MNTILMKYKFSIPLLFVCLFLFSCQSTEQKKANSQVEKQLNTAVSQVQSEAKGSLFIIGGGERDEALIQEMANTADLSEADYIVILPMSSSEPHTAAQYISEQLQAVTNRPIKSINFTKAMTDDEQLLDSVKNAKLIYIPGGDQGRFMDVVAGTPLFDAIHEAYSKGACIAGTSAGAAVMSSHMISGQQLMPDTSYRETFEKLQDKNIELVPGLGLMDGAIIDQHFIKRSRYNRLLSALAAHPDLVSIGIDESTAIIVKGDQVQVVGNYQAVFAKNPVDLKINSEGRITFKDVQLSVLGAGESYSLQ